MRGLRRWLPRWLHPKIGELRQYPPRPLTLPPGYAAARASPSAPRISIVVPSYNQGRFLRATLDSVLGQNYPNLELIVQDGASSDESAAVLREYSQRLTHWESQRDNGQAHAINLGFRHATGEVLAYLNSDDLLLPGALAYVGDYFERKPAVDVVYGHRVNIDESGLEIGRWILPAHQNEILRWADFVPQETLFWRRRIWERAGGAMDESFRFALDWDLLLRFLAHGARFSRLPRFLGAFRIHEAQKTSAEMGETGAREIDRLWQRIHGYPRIRLEASPLAVRWYLLQSVVIYHLHRLSLLRY
jgi:glycosyltransferase involved in cell wall biosynthesis